jgi:hypothetical protein
MAILRTVDPDYEPLTIGECSVWFSPEFPHAAGVSPRPYRPARRSPRHHATRRPGLPITYILAGVVLGAGLVILVALALLPQSVGAKQPDAPPPSHPAALQESV